MTFFYTAAHTTPSRIRNTLFESKLLSQGSIEQDRLWKIVKNLGKTKRSISILNQLKNQQFYDLLFIIVIYFIHIVNEHPSEMQN